MTHLTRAQADAAFIGDRGQNISLFQRIMLTFHEACDARDIDVATRLLKILELMAAASGDGASHDPIHARRGFVAASERLWNLRFNDPSGAYPRRC
jgi:hypothetical protein